MVKAITLLISIFLSIGMLYAQTTFMKNYGGNGWDNCNTADYTSDGGYIMAGFTTSFGIDYDIFVVKTDSSGDTLWTKSYGDSLNDVCYSIRQTFDGGYILAGYSQGVTTIATLLKIDSVGIVQWMKTYSGGSLDIAFNVKQNADSGYIVTGRTQQPGFWDDLFLIRTNAAGATIWSKQYGGASDIDVGYSVLQSQDGGFLAVGQTRSFAVGVTDIYMVKTDAAGNHMWSKTFGGADADYAWTVISTSDGGYLMAGSYVILPAGLYDFVMIKTDVNSDTLWTKIYPVSENDDIKSVQQTADGGYIVAGITKSVGAGETDALLMKTDPYGNVQWASSYGGVSFDWVYTVFETSDGGYSMACTHNAQTFNQHDFSLIKTDAFGHAGCNETIENTWQAISGCTLSNPATITSLYVPTVSTLLLPEGSGVDVNVLCSTTGITIPEQSFTFSLSPATGNSWIAKFSKMIVSGKIEVFNMQGQLVLSEKIANASFQSFTVFQKGIFLIRIEDSSSSFCLKFIASDF